MKNETPEIISFSEFQKVTIQTGTIIKVEEFPEARKPAFKLWISLGNGIVKRSSAQITINYTPEQLLNTQVICVTNLAPRQIGKFVSEVLVTGFEDSKGNIVLARPDYNVQDGKLLF